MSSWTVEALIAAGYCVTSRKHCEVSRVDRPDWREYMAKQHAPWCRKEGMAWVDAMGVGAEDHYRRVYSRDSRQIDDVALRSFPPSGNTCTGFRLKPPQIKGLG